jgi:hypothetical protein
MNNAPTQENSRTSLNSAFMCRSPLSPPWPKSDKNQLKLCNDRTGRHAACDGRAGLSWPLPEVLTDEMLERRLYPLPAVGRDRRSQPEWAGVHRELRRPGVTLRLLWEERRAAFADGYGYSRF